jgi:hypothetical protein
MNRQAAVVLGAFLGALGTQGLWAGDNDRAVPRGGGSSSGGSHGGGSSAMDRHPGSSGSSHGSTYSAPSGSSGAYQSSRTPRTGAQSRHPRPGQGHSGHGHGGYYGGHGGYYGGYYPYYDPYYWGYGYWPWYYPYYGGFYAGFGFGYPFYGGPYVGGAYYGGYPDIAGSVRVIVEPTKTKVYVDEYYAGVVDDFDGMFQRLNLKPGRHDVTLKLDGYETHKVKLYVPLDGTIKIKHKMVKGTPGQVSESTVGDPADEERYAQLERQRRQDYERYRSEQRAEKEDRYPSRDRADDSTPASRERGTLRLDVSPADASIYVDGTFRGTGQDLRRLNLPPGRHRLEVVRPGYQTLERDVEVREGETEEVAVDLVKS